jgi:hypothetical protein
MLLAGISGKVYLTGWPACKAVPRYRQQQLILAYLVGTAVAAVFVSKDAAAVALRPPSVPVACAAGAANQRAAPCPVAERGSLLVGVGHGPNLGNRRPRQHSVPTVMRREGVPVSEIALAAV